MNNRAIRWLQTVLFEGDRRWAGLALALICVGAGVIAGTYVAILSPLLAVAAAVALFVALLVLRSTRWGLFALVAVACLLPFAALPIRLGFSPTFLDLVLLAIFFVWASSFLQGNRKEFVTTPLGLPIVLFMALACASFVAGLTHSRPNSYVIRHFAEILMAIGLFFVIVNSIRSVQALRQVIGVTVVAGAAQAALGVFLYVIPSPWTVRLLSALGRFNYPTGAGILRYIEDNPELPLRAIGTSVDPNVLGGLMILIGGLLAPHLFAPRPLFKRWMIAGMLAIVSLCLYLTYSRAAMAGFASSLLFVGLLKHRKWLLVVLLAGALLLLLPQTQPYVLRFMEGIQGQDRATLMRLGEYKDAFILISRYPWFGVGFAGTPDIDTYLGVSSAYLLMAEQMGLVGVGVFLLVIVGFFVFTLGTLRRYLRALPAEDRHDLEPLLLGVMAGLAGALVAGILDHYFFNFDFPHSITLFWLFIGLGIAAAQVARRSDAAGAGRNLPHSVNSISVRMSVPSAQSSRPFSSEYHPKTSR